MKLSQAKYKLGILREFLSSISQDIIKVIRIDVKNTGIVIIDQSYSYQFLEDSQDKDNIDIDFTNVEEVHIFGYLPNKLETSVVGENHIERNTTRSIFIRCIDMWLRVEFGIVIDKPIEITSNEWCFKASSFRKV